ncbi:hypothetical protein FOXYSP1_11785 [Fusarium oxysporum f. sp. phaseoli]
MSTCINGERRRSFPPSRTFLSVASPTGRQSSSSSILSAQLRITFKRASRQREQIPLQPGIPLHR